MSTDLIPTKEEKPMEYIPFGGQDKIKLTVAIVQNLICIKTKSGKTCSPADAIKFMMMCQARRLNPFEGDAYLIGYDGREGPSFSLITAHQAFLKRAEVNSEYDGLKSGIIVEEDEQLKDLEGDFYTNGQKVVGGWATVYFKNRKQPMHKRIRLERFRKSFGVWTEDAAGMICKCAEADALRSSFPTMLGGLYIKEETSPQQPLLETTTPLFTTPPSTAPAEPPQEQAAPKQPPKKAKPATVEVAPAAEEPSFENAEPPAENDKLKTIASNLSLARITEEQLMNLLRKVEVIDRNVKTLADVTPDVLDLIIEQFSDIAGRIRLETKEAK